MENKPLSEVSLACMFSHRVGSLFNLMRSHLFIFFFMSLALGEISVKMLLHGMSEIFLPMFSSRTFMVSWLIFKSFIHLEFIFVYGVSWWSSFIFFACSCPDLPTPFVEEAIFTPKYIKNSHNSTLGRQTTQLKNGQKTWTDTSPRRTYRGPKTYKKMFSITSHQRDTN